jgi:uncharacterized protein
MAMTLIRIGFVAVGGSIVLFLVSYSLLIIGTLLLAIVTQYRQRQRQKQQQQQHQQYQIKSRLLVGRVSHSRKLPATHSFAYPIFMAWIDLDEEYNDVMYPLSLVMQLRAKEDHYKNNEGHLGVDDDEGEKAISNQTSPGSTTAAATVGRACSSVSEWLTLRTLRLVAERTHNKFQPTRGTHTVKLLTHLRYYGYCFNPVSFYYVLRKPHPDDNDNYKIDAIVAEVSNTPWNEMQCYVLHPHSIDIQTVKEGRPKPLKPNRRDLAGINYIFPKTFHVSPFMDMDHMYDWTFWELPPEEPQPQQPSSSGAPFLCISTSMYKGQDLYFNAYLQLSNYGCHPMTLAFQLIRYPIFCFIVQIWIHIQAFFVFYKGVPYVPHPMGSETTASLIIGKAMTPIFAFKDWWDAKVGATTKMKEQ